MSELQPPRGTRDLLPPESEHFGEHERRGIDLFERAGYRRVITPTFEDTSLFTRGVGESTDIVTKEMYTFKDRSDNLLTLRPEGTAPVIRAVISNKLWDRGLPIKLCYSAAMFRYDRPQKGRYREHHQLGIEAIGTDDPAVDAEVVALGGRMLAGAGIADATLLLNSIGHPAAECRGEYLPSLRAFLDRHRERLDEDCNRRMNTNPMRVFDCKNPDDQELLAEAPTIDQFLCAECRAHFEAVQAQLKDLGVTYTIAPRLVRGLDYYTRTTFEYQTTLLEAAQSTVCGGGRYDGLSEMLGGPSLPGIGFGSGIERVLLAQEAAAAAPPVRALDVIVVPVGEEERGPATRLMWSLRDAGCSADLAYGAPSIKGGLKRANREGARYAALIGPTEREAGTATMRNMGSGEQEQVRLDGVAVWLKERAR